jgi:hypothetical protein
MAFWGQGIAIADTMHAPLQITFNGVAHPDAIKAAAHEKLRQLERSAGPVLACRLLIRALEKNHHRGRPLVVRLEVSVPGRELVVDGVEHRDVYVGLQRAFEDAKRQLLGAVPHRGDHRVRHAPAFPAGNARPEGHGGATQRL